MASTIRTWIGLDAGAAQVRAAQLRRVRGSLRIEALSVIPRRDPGGPLTGDEIVHIQSVLERQGFEGKHIVAAAPRDEVLTGILDLPPMDSGAPLDRIARVELARMHNQDPQGIEMCYWQLPVSQRSTDCSQVFAAGLPHAAADAFLDCFETAGVEVKALDLHTTAMARACAAMATSGPDVVAVLDIGWQRSWLLILYHGVVIYERCLAGAGVKDLVEGVQRRCAVDGQTARKLLSRVDLNHPDGEADVARLRQTVEAHYDDILAELDAPFSYVPHQYPDVRVQRLLLVGAAGTHGLADRFAEKLAIGVCTVSPSDLAQCPSHIGPRCHDPSLTLAVGLAQFAGRRAA